MRAQREDYLNTDFIDFSDFFATNTYGTEAEGGGKILNPNPAQPEPKRVDKRLTP